MDLVFDIGKRTLTVTNDTFKTTANEPLTVDLKKNGVAYELATGETLTLIILPAGQSDAAKLVQQEITPDKYDSASKLYVATFSAYTEPALELVGIGNSTVQDDVADPSRVELVLVFKTADDVKTESFTALAKLARSLDLPDSPAPGVVPTFSFSLTDDESYLNVYLNGGLVFKVPGIAP